MVTDNRNLTAEQIATEEAAGMPLDWKLAKKYQDGSLNEHVPTRDVTVFGPVDGFNEPCKDGSYIRLSSGAFVCRISRGAAEVLAAELLGIVGIPEPDEDLVRDAARYNYLADHCSYRYSATQDSPMECGIEWQFQQSMPDEAAMTLDQLIDMDIKAQEIREREDEE